MRSRVEQSHRFEVDESSGTNQEPCIPSFVLMGESDVYMNFPNLLAIAEVRAQAIQMAKSWPFEKLHQQLLKHQISVSVELRDREFFISFSNI